MFMNEQKRMPSKEMGRGQDQAIEIIDVYDNQIADLKRGLEASWGFSCVIRGPGKTVLFDVGRHAEILLSNMKALDVSPDEIDAVILSHSDDNHSGGLLELLEEKPAVDVYLLDTYTDEFYAKIKSRGANIILAGQPLQVAEYLYTTGAMPGNRQGASHLGKYEQSVIIAADEGLIVITGCAHANMVSVAEKATQLLGREIMMMAGGFHCRNSSAAEIAAMIFHPRIEWIPFLAPTHCSGDLIVRLLQLKGWSTVVGFGLGKVLRPGKLT
jgi:7,8-dihydropterin-6-yl-methyl-4-(beta-D-ribofuranosyl)aminobenzene 5'-phosphate synthase